MSLLSAAFQLWSTLTHTDPEAESIRLDDWTLASMHRELEEALTLDPTHTTALLLLDAFTHTYFEHRAFTVNELLDDPQGTRTQYLDHARRLTTLLNDPAINEIRTRFRTRLHQAMAHYDADRPDLDAVITDRYALPLLRRDALKSFQTLTRYDFFDGPLSQEPPQYLQTVLRFWNINSLIQAALTWPSGLSLHLIQDPDILHSYFVFVCRNGGRLTILTDRPEQAHPLQRFMSRRPDRQFVARTWRHHFPYQLMDLTITDEDRVHYHAQTGLVRYGHTQTPLARLQTLEPDQLLWIAMIFDLCVDHLWTTPVTPDTLAYTAASLQAPQVQIPTANVAHVPVLHPTQPAWRPLTLADVRTAAVTEEQVGEQPTKHTVWMEERYADQLNPTYLEFLQDDRQRYALDETSGALLVLPAEESSRQPFELQSLNPTVFHTKAQLEADRIFLARHNLAVQILRCAQAEYTTTKNQVIAWYHEHVIANLPRLYEAMRTGHLTVSRQFQYQQFARGAAPTTCDIMRVELALRHRIRFPHQNALHLHGGVTDSRELRCYQTGAKASYAITFQPPDVAALAVLCGCPIAALPDVLQHWYRPNEQPYVGNPILSRIDPFEWVIENPWSELDLTVSLYLSKRAYQAILASAKTSA